MSPPGVRIIFRPGRPLGLIVDESAYRLEIVSQWILRHPEVGFLVNLERRRRNLDSTGHVRPLSPKSAGSPAFDLNKTSVTHVWPEGQDYFPRT